MEESIETVGDLIDLLEKMDRSLPVRVLREDIMERVEILKVEKEDLEFEDPSEVCTIFIA